ncbi:MAG: energy-coupled thiamine transporter ThiT [Clostridia bacterium]|nr:energy-coupled thiamine transporter ThiT [Clostridia bacterium]
MKTKSSKQIVAMIECSMMIALSTVFSLIKLVDMPYGGSVTIASMLPIVIAAYRHGFLWGLGTALTNSLIQLLLGINNLSYFSTWQSIVAIILLDYVVAFGVFALSGLFRKIEKRQNLAFLYGILLASVLRYVCHVISGATVWAGLSIPTNAALIYSLSYNATYMVPETIVLIALGVYLASVIDFGTQYPTRIKTQKLDKVEVYTMIFGWFMLIATMITDIILVAPYLQDPESGEFVFTYLGDVNYVKLAVVSVVGVAMSVALFVISLVRKKTNQKAEAK